MGRISHVTKDPNKPLVVAVYGDALVADEKDEGDKTGKAGDLGQHGAPDGTGRWQGRAGPAGTGRIGRRVCGERDWCDGLRGGGVQACAPRKPRPGPRSGVVVEHAPRSNSALHLRMLIEIVTRGVGEPAGGHRQARGASGGARTYTARGLFRFRAFLAWSTADAGHFLGLRITQPSSKGNCQLSAICCLLRALLLGLVTSKAHRLDKRPLSPPQHTSTHPHTNPTHFTQPALYTAPPHSPRSFGPSAT